MKKKFQCLALAMVSCFGSAWALAADFDGSKPLLRATVDAHDCDAGEICLRALPAELGAPQFLRIDFAKKTVAGPERTTPIRFMEAGQIQILLQGTELGYAWTIVLDRADGAMAVTLVNREDVVVLFGACTPM